jgi:hypothetical protein
VTSGTSVRLHPSPSLITFWVQGETPNGTTVSAIQIAAITVQDGLDTFQQSNTHVTNNTTTMTASINCRVSIDSDHRTLLGICRKLMAPGLYQNKEVGGRQLLQRLLRRTDKPSALEIIVGVLLAARLCDQDIDVRVRAIVAVADSGTNPEDYPVEMIHEPFDHDLRNDDDEVSALVASLVPASDGCSFPVPNNQARS